MKSIGDLLARLSAATKGSRELDAEIYAATSWDAGVLTTEEWKAVIERYSRDYPCDACGSTAYQSCPRYTTSLDAARTIVPKGWRWIIEDLGDDSFRVSLRQSYEQGLREHSVTGRNPALAMCIIALAAHGGVTLCGT
jgi:hypothetical protein